MVYRYDYDVKNELIDLLETKQDFSGVLEMPYYLEQYHQETSTARQNLQRFLIYKLSYYLDDSIFIKSVDILLDFLLLHPYSFLWNHDGFISIVCVYMERTR